MNTSTIPSLHFAKPTTLVTFVAKPSGVAGTNTSMLRGAWIRSARDDPPAVVRRRSSFAQLVTERGVCRE
jgi:hypothetical protein